MQIKSLLQILDSLAPSVYQENYDNAGLITGNAMWECSGALCTLDVTEEVVNEAIRKCCNLIVAHHPIIFGGLKKLTGKTYVERVVIKAIRNDIAIYAIHTNLDNILSGVNNMMADKLGLVNRKVLLHKPNTLMKLVVFVPESHAEKVRNALFEAGGGNIGNYSECSFSTKGTGSFKPGKGSDPFIGEQGERELAEEERVEVIFPVYLRETLIATMKAAHPYEEVAYDLIALENNCDQVGSGLLGELETEMDEMDFLHFIRKQFRLEVIRHTPLLNKKVKKIALCGGAGSFLIKNALAAGADFYLTSDVKYHEFFDAENRMVISDIGHFESEQFTTDLLHDILHSNFPTFAVLKTEVKTNPVNYFS